MGRDYNSILPVFEQGSGIPKFIYQTYKSKVIENAELNANIGHIQSLNPYWEYSLYDDADIEDFILKHYGEEVYAYYNRIDSSYGAAKADFFRYLLLYKMGGVYLDIKSTLERPLDDVLLPDEQYIVSAPGHPFLRAVILRVMQCIDLYNPWKTGIGLCGVLRTTGPIPYTLAIYDMLEKRVAYARQYRIVPRIEDLGFRYSIYDRGTQLRGHRNVIATYEKGKKPVIRMGGCVKTKLIEWIFVLEWKLRACLDAYRRLRKTWAK